MRVELGTCPCCKVDLALEVEFSTGQTTGRLITRIDRAELRASNLPPGEGTNLAHQVLINAKKRYPKSHIDRQDGQDQA
jgi:hypothetical protein